MVGLSAPSFIANQNPNILFKIPLLSYIIILTLFLIRNKLLLIIYYYAQFNVFNFIRDKYILKINTEKNRALNLN